MFKYSWDYKETLAAGGIQNDVQRSAGLQHQAHKSTCCEHIKLEKEQKQWLELNSLRGLEEIV